jgi:trehalose 6-phosphate synthase/phosphatase
LPGMERRLFIVSNRLPATVDNDKRIIQASGGLVSAVTSYITKGENSSFSEILWAGVPGCSADTWTTASRELENQTFTYLPVFVPETEYEGYYSGHANSVLWPLFHYFPSYAEYSVDNYDHYIRVNTHFADILLKHLHPSDVVWIHDYHLLPLAAMLRKEMPDLTIGFFLHIPFPSFEVFRLMPKKWQEELLRGMLGADLIGFHTIDYASHFLQSILMILGLDNDRHLIHHDNRIIKVDVFPISIDFNKFYNAYDADRVALLRQSLKDKGEKKIIFSIDRLDYTKGVHNRLKAYEYFLQQYPEYREKVVFILVTIPSRDSIPKYAERKRMIDELISHINSGIGSIHWVPVIYQYNSLEFEELIALYSACDLALITPLRDGMNLIAKEFVASRKDKKGVLVISEMAGAARELTDALTINPNDVLEMAQKIKEGLEMKEEEQALRLENMQRRIANYDVQAWANDFMSELHNIKHKQESFRIKFLDTYAKRNLYDAYRSAKSRLLLLDYDGTLVPFSSKPDMAVPDRDLLNLLKRLSEKKGNDVFIISGRSSSWLENHFAGLPINLIAEHGARYKWKNDSWVTEIQTHQEWKEQVHNIMDIYVRRCANTFVEEKEFSMVWHYRNASIVQGKLRAFELVRELNDYIHNRHLQVMMGNKNVEVKHSGINKGSFIKTLISNNEYDFIFAAGDDRTDEDMFRELISRSNAFTIKVGPEASYAQYNLHTPQMIVSLLEGMSHLPLLVAT